MFRSSAGSANTVVPAGRDMSITRPAPVSPVLDGLVFLNVQDHKEQPLTNSKCLGVASILVNTVLLQRRVLSGSSSIGTTGSSAGTHRVEWLKLFKWLPSGCGPTSLSGVMSTDR